MWDWLLCLSATGSRTSTSSLKDNDNDVYFTLATSDSRISKYKTVGEQLTHKNRSIYNAIWIIKRDLCYRVIFQLHGEQTNLDQIPRKLAELKGPMT